MKAFLVFGAVLLVVLSSCDEIAPTCLCTTDFAIVAFHVVDASGNPQEDVEITVWHPRKEKILAIVQNFPLAGGYVAINDSFRKEIKSSGEEITVTGQKQDKEFSASFVIAVPGECRCHVSKVAGPDTVVVVEK